MEHRKYRWTLVLLFINMLFWIRFLVEYLVRFTGNNPEPLYIVLFALLFLDMAAYGVLAFGLWRNIKWLKALLIPFLILNAALSVTDQIGPWDIAALLMNAGACAAYLLERRTGKGCAGCDTATKNKSFFSSFIYAAHGIAHCVRCERSFRIELALALPALLACVLLEVTPVEAACVILCCAAVLGAELINSALERAVDLAASGEYSELAKRAKDMGAGAVLVAAIGAAIVGVCVFLPRILAALFD